MKLILVCLVGAALLFSSCTRNPVIATVGDFKIYKSDPDYKNTITRIYYPAESRDLGLELLTKSYTMAQVLRNNGHEITESTIQKEMERIEKNSLRPEILARIRGLFGDDVEAFKRVYILPTYAERVIYYEFFLRDKRIQAESLKKVEAFIAEAKKTPAKFGDLAKTAGRTKGNFTVSLTEGYQWEMPKEQLPPGMPARDVAQAPKSEVEMKLKQRDAARVSEEGKRWIEDIVKKLKPGEVYSTAIDMNEHWLVARYIGPKKKAADTYQFEGVSFPKEDYSQWLEKEQKKVKISRK